MKVVKPFINSVYLKDFAKRARLEQTEKGVYYYTEYQELDADFFNHEATVYGVPKFLRSGDELEIKEGDRVLCHHFVSDESCIKNINGELISELYYTDVYAKYNDGVIEPIQDYVFLEPIPEKRSSFENGLFITKKGDRKRVGKVAFVNKNVNWCSIGDYVVFKENRDYKMKVGGKFYYRMKEDDLFAIVDSIEKVVVL